MAIQKQEFYEGAALHRLIRSGVLDRVHTDPPFFVANDGLVIHIKYCTKTRGPWAFTFTYEEQQLLVQRADRGPLVLGLVCGGDGVVALDFKAYLSIAALQPSSVRVACQRHHGTHYTVVGPSGDLKKKVSPSAWQRILKAKGSHEAS